MTEKIIKPTSRDLREFYDRFAPYMTFEQKKALLEQEKETFDKEQRRDMIKIVICIGIGVSPVIALVVKSLLL